MSESFTIICQEIEISSSTICYTEIQKNCFVEVLFLCSIPKQSACNHNRKPLSALSLVFLGMTNHEIVSQQVGHQRHYLVCLVVKHTFENTTLFHKMSAMNYAEQSVNIVTYKKTPKLLSK